MNGSSNVLLFNSSVSQSARYILQQSASLCFDCSLSLSLSARLLFVATSAIPFSSPPLYDTIFSFLSIAFLSQSQFSQLDRLLHKARRRRTDRPLTRYRYGHTRTQLLKSSHPVKMHRILQLEYILIYFSQ